MKIYQITLPEGLKEKQLLVLIRRNLRSWTEGIVVAGLDACLMLGKRASPLRSTVARLLRKKWLSWSAHQKAIHVLEVLDVRSWRLLWSLSKLIKRYARYWEEGHGAQLCAERAVRYLLRYQGSWGSLYVLGKALKSPQMRVRQAAAETLAKLGKKARPKFRQLLRFVREEAYEYKTHQTKKRANFFGALCAGISALGRIGRRSEEVIGLLYELRAEDGLPIKAACLGAECAFDLPITESIYELWRRYEDVFSQPGSHHRPSKTDLVFNGLCEGMFLGLERLSEQNIKELLMLFRHTKEAGIRHFVADFLGRGKAEAAISDLAAAAAPSTSDKDWRILCIEALGRIGPPAFSMGPMLVSMLHGEELEIKREAIGALLAIGKEGVKDAMSDITLAAFDLDVQVRECARELLAELGVTLEEDESSVGDSDDDQGMQYLRVA